MSMRPGLGKKIGRVLWKIFLGLLIGGISLPVLLFIAFCIYLAIPAPEKEGTDRPAWLPPTATDVFYRARGGFGWTKAAEFTISESDFRDYAAQQGWELKEETDYDLPFANQLIRPKGRAFTYADRKEIKRALIFEKRFDNGGGTTFVFDSLNSKAFYFKNHL